MTFRPLLVALALVAGCGEAPAPTTTEAAAPPARTTMAVSEARTTVRGCPIDVSLSADKAAFTLGEPVFLTFRVSTTCGEELAVIDGGDYRNRLGRAESYSVTALDASGDGAPVTVIDAGWQFGGLMGPRPLPFDKRLLLAHWVEFTRPGPYLVTVQKTLLVGGVTVDTEDKTPWSVTVSIDVDVLPPSREALGEVIEANGAELDTNDEAMTRLLAIDNARVVPHFARAIDAGGTRAMSAVWGLGRFADDDALAALTRALGVDDLHLAAAQTLAVNAHPRAWDVLWSQRADRNESVRLTVLHALAKRDAPNLLAQLAPFEADGSKMVRDEAARYRAEKLARR
jgi:hypothetical protein